MDAEDRHKKIAQLKRMAVVALVLSCALTILIVIQGITLLNLINRADSGRIATCDFYGHVADIPVTSGTTTQIRDIIKDAEKAYQERGCNSR